MQLLKGGEVQKHFFDGKYDVWVLGRILVVEGVVECCWPGWKELSLLGRLENDEFGGQLVMEGSFDGMTRVLVES